MRWFLAATVRVYTDWASKSTWPTREREPLVELRWNSVPSLPASMLYWIAALLPLSLSLACTTRSC